MVRSMYSGVSGLRTHQTRMDTIGNNIANVNTYGYKSARTTFRDIYYQTMSSAAGPTAAVGGQNPSEVGYGTQVGSIDLMMGRSTLTMTDQTMDLAIDGDGFFQVMDGAGNIFYTRAGMLNFDAAGNLVDMQGNFVLGVNGDPTGQGPGKDRITVALPAVDPTVASVIQTINNKKFEIAAQFPTTEGNMNFTFTTDSSVTDGEVTAQITSTGINIRMHPDNVYNNWGELSAQVNRAITEANGGTTHPAGDFTISTPDFDAFSEGPLKASDITSTNFGVNLGSASFTSSDVFFGGIKPTGKVGSTFSGTGDMEDFNAEFSDPPGEWIISMEVGGTIYEGKIGSNATSSGTFNLKNTAPGADENDYIQMSRPSFKAINDAWLAVPGNSGANGVQTVLTLTAPGAPVSPVPAAINVMGYTIQLDAADTTVNDQMTRIMNTLNAVSNFGYTVAFSGGDLEFTAKKPGADTGSLTSNFGSIAVTTPGKDPGPINASDFGGAIPGNQLSNTGVPPVAKPSTKSKGLGFSGTSFALRGGTEGGAQTIADMRGISIAPNGIIVGLDSVGATIVIGRIDLATFANAAGLAQSGSSLFAESANSGEAILTQPGTAGAGKLVGGSLELSNVDLSREFSDMITTQRGYQANSRIITVSDTMLEELINLKR